MEEPDLEELEWMACQPPEEDDAEDYCDDFPLTSHTRGGLEAQLVASSHDGSCHKRLWSDGGLNEQDDVLKEAATAKRSRGLSDISSYDCLEKAWLGPHPALKASTEKEWSPPPPPIVSCRCPSLHEKATSSNVSTEKAWSLSPPPPAPSLSTVEQGAVAEEALHTFAPVDQEEAVATEIQPPVPCQLPHRRAADIAGDFISITGASGERVYAARVVPQISSKNKFSYSAIRKGLLSRPIEALIEQLEHEAFEQVVAASEKKDHGEDNSKEMEEAMVHEELWVDKFAPRSFTDLLSDEQTNREVLRWLKQWDPCVFGSKKHSTSDEVLTSLRRQLPQSQARGFGEARGSFNQSLIGGLSGGAHGNVNGLGWQSHSSFSNPEPARKLGTNDQATSDRPEEKVLLLCGPPGLGKTTLAHVAAKHCGYRIVEINASDDRVATTLQGKILDAIQMKSVMGERRPNCLVIDEIDGVLGGMEGKGAIDSLIEIINAEKKLSRERENDEDDGISKKVSKKRAGSAVRRLSRPVICICNDLYAPALRALRQVARVHVFARPSTSRVVSRLKYICSMEGYKTNARALTALAEHTECDIRSCLNTLQFLKRRRQSLKTLDVESQVIGRKDMTSSIFDIWAEVFHRRKVRSGAVMRGMVDMSENGGPQHKDFARLHGLFTKHGDYELAMNGIHENILHIRYHDASLHKTVEALEWMGAAEIFGHRVVSKQQFFLLAYQPSTLIAIRSLVAQPDRPQVEWPKSFQRYRSEIAVKKEMLSSWLAAMSATVSRSLSAARLAVDMVSPFLSILSPPSLRPVASQLLSSKEKEEILQLVDTMIGYGISYKHPKLGLLTASKPEYGLDGHGVLLLDPPIDSFIKFKASAARQPQLSSTLRQMLGHEVEMEKLRREGALRAARIASTTQLQPRGAIAATSINREGEQECLHSMIKSKNGGSELSSPTGNQTASSDIMRGREYLGSSEKSAAYLPLSDSRKTIVGKAGALQTTNFFERFKKSAQRGVSAEAKANSEIATMQRDSRPLLYKFHEGFTNAVKRPMLLRDFL